MTQEEQSTLMKASSVLRLESRSYHDLYKRNADASSKHSREEGFKAFEIYSQMQKLAHELDIIAGGL